MKKQIKVKIPAQTVIVYVEEWATDFGVAEKDVKADVLNYFYNWQSEQLERLGLGKAA